MPYRRLILIFFLILIIAGLSIVGTLYLEKLQKNKPNNNVNKQSIKEEKIETELPPKKTYGNFTPPQNRIVTQNQFHKYSEVKGALVDFIESFKKRYVEQLSKETDEHKEEVLGALLSIEYMKTFADEKFRALDKAGLSENEYRWIEDQIDIAINSYTASEAIDKIVQKYNDQKRDLEKKLEIINKRLKEENLKDSEKDALNKQANQIQNSLTAINISIRQSSNVYKESPKENIDLVLTNMDKLKEFSKYNAMGL